MRWLIPIGFATSSVALRLLLQHAPHRIATDLNQPIPVATSWGTYGLLCFFALILGIAIATIGYIATLQTSATVIPSEASQTRSGGTASTPNLGSIIVPATLALLATTLTPILFSSDIYAYAAYGEMATRGIDPYTQTHIAISANSQSDALFRAAIWQWRNPFPACVYGPLFVQLSRALVALGSTVVTQLNLFRIVSSLALLLCAPLAYFAFAGRKEHERLFAAAVITLNPVALWCASEGHNDAIALCLALAGFAIANTANAALAGKAAIAFFTALGTAIVAFSAALKLPGLIAALAFPIVIRNDRTRAAYVWLGFAAGTIAFLAISWHPIAELLAGFTQTARAHPSQLHFPYLYPWYGLWLLPIAALSPRSRWSHALIAVSFILLLRYIPDVY